MSLALLHRFDRKLDIYCESIILRLIDLGWEQELMWMNDTEERWIPDLTSLEVVRTPKELTEKSTSI